MDINGKLGGQEKSIISLVESLYHIYTHNYHQFVLPIDFEFSDEQNMNSQLIFQMGIRSYLLISELIV